MQPCRCRSSMQHSPPTTTSVEPAWCSPCSTSTSTSTPPLVHGPRTATTSYLSRIMKKKREEKHEAHWLTHSLVAVRSRLKSAEVVAAAVRQKKINKKKSPSARNTGWKCCVGLARPQMSPPAQRHKDGCVDLGQISAGGPHLAACRLFSPGYILGLVKAPAIKHTLLPSRAPFLSPNPLPLCSLAGS